MSFDRRTFLKGLGLSAIGLAGGTGAGNDDLAFVSQAAAATPPEQTVNFADDVIYQLISDRFRDGNPNNNPTGELASDDCSNLRKYCGGDWQGIIDKIQSGYLTDLGVSAVWISPPFENITAVDSDIGTSYHGYWARDFTDPNEFFGDMETFKQLVDVAHQNGIKVVIDFVPNHTSPSTSDGELEDGALYDNGSYVAAYNDDPKSYFHHNGGTDYSSYEDQIYRNLYNLADFDHHEAYIDQYLKDAIKQWLDAGIDGIRVDAVAHMPPKWQKTLVDTIYDHRPVFTFGEWFLGADQSNPRYYEFSNDSGMSLLDFRFGQEIRQVLRDFTDDWYGFRDMLQETESEHDQVIDQVPFIDNHDMPRFTVADGDTRNTDMALAVLLTSRGTPAVYYGTEQYLTGGNDPDNRKPMPSFDTTTTAYKVIQALTSLRSSNPALAYGDTEERWINSDVFVYEREFGDNVVLVAINRSLDWYDVSGLQTSLPEGTYDDALGGTLDGFSTTVNTDGSIDTFSVGPQTVCVWEHTGTTAEPALGHVGPTMGQPGHTVVLSGDGFGSTEGSVEFGTTSASITSWSNTEIEATVPAVSGGYYDVTVTDANGAQSDPFSGYEVLSGDQISARFVVNDATTDVGENVYVVGNVHELGDWDTDRAVGPFFNQVVHEYPNWYYDVNLPAGTDIEFKFVKIASDGTVTWESGSNRQYTTPTDSTGEYSGTWK
ncbi:alpha-amylase [Haloferax mediterranei ATCC 33500]|uniref:Alpha-amylase n=1 Tax=Haloferax mediterranei (strain ATCC 33500 / DSM 1411 / JCM 8866 / NBRC 14739 / NCIMB 2177 / R-4) TaxID=523841 RepID=I3R202_HALMT|nr:alpha-amylase family glycosyl hydrolase [Haloferax mediterranei]AFK18262.1 cyclomaltodextrin glucanotransferase [Haloferax mediterranei ATCC 33500]AHZ22336.1 alpha-amylase [Haloferax mediterranei ATCC 33500]EMA02465.1 cyclomaltodextrin glucanotransferase [Haloferax mediterranei ATCC 33500]MDX5988352.1 alpha-amylase family glycosyl hydrolase [Haloferax mediterranei ATCC 33500]QCQ74785.1 alpha-amylase [Haloferax mediterranei ATCC 33500]